MINDILGLLAVVGAILFVIHCPVFKPWYGFRKPKGHQGRWWT